MPQPYSFEAPTDETSDGGHFATMPKDISHVTFYFDTTPEDREDESFFFVKIETPESVEDDLDVWYEAALTEILARNADLAEAELAGVAIKFGSGQGGSGGEFYYRLDGDSTDVDNPQTGGLVAARDFKAYDGGVEYQYGDLF